jgi:hypothetical protein
MTIKIIMWSQVERPTAMDLNALKPLQYIVTPHYTQSICTYFDSDIY